MLSRWRQRQKAVEDEPRLPRYSQWAIALAVVLGVWGWFERPPVTDAPTPAGAVIAPTPAADAAQTQASAEAMRLIRDERGCLTPSTFKRLRQPVEMPDPKTWTTPSAAGDRLRSDRCGRLWALWFNSWDVIEGNPPARIAHLALPSQGELGSLSKAGVASFEFSEEQDLWLLGRNGAVARHRGHDWEALPGRDDCPQGQLRRVRLEMWVACGGQREPAVARWNEAGQRWDMIGGAPPGARVLMVDVRDRAWTAAAGVLARRDAGRDQGWQALPAEHPQPTVLVQSGERILLGSDSGLWLYDSEGAPLGEALTGRHITGIAPAAHGRAWVSARNEGLHYFDGERWHAWPEAQGLPDTAGRDVLLDVFGGLWLGGTPVAYMQAAIAAEQIRRLPAPADTVAP